MAYIELESCKNNREKLLIFAEGTILKPKSIWSFFNHNEYIPIGNSVEIIQKWQSQGVEIYYCTSRKGKQAQELANLLKRLNFVGTGLYYREKNHQYKDIVETVRPDVLIEDDCRSIGGAWQMCITYVSPSVKALIKSVVVKEFVGIDHLPKDYWNLKSS